MLTNERENQATAIQVERDCRGEMKHRLQIPGARALMASLLLAALSARLAAVEDATPWQHEDHGPFFSSSMVWSKPTLNWTDKGISIRLAANHQAAVCFDTELLRVSGAWTGGFIKIPPGRDVATHPDPAGVIEFGCPRLPGWSTNQDFSDPRPDQFGPLPVQRGHYQGLYLHGDEVVLSYSVAGSSILDSFDLETSDDQHTFARTIEVGPSGNPLTVVVCDLPGSTGRLEGDRTRVVLERAAGLAAAAVIGNSPDCKLQFVKDGQVRLLFPPHEHTVRAKVLVWTGGKTALARFVALANASPLPRDLAALTRGGPSRWRPSLLAHGDLSKASGPYVVDTLTAPDDNPWKSYLRFSGFDFFSNGDAAICSVSGDVWIISGCDATLDKLKWRRFATGLFQPLGLKIVDDVVYVLGRDQITRLHDLDGDGEADFYENFNNGGKASARQPHYSTCLETDAEGNFYYAQGANPTSQGGTLLKVSRDGSKIEVVAPGLRSCNGMAISPDGIISVSDNEGGWVPASRLDFVKPGQFLGYTPMAHGPTPNDPGYPIWIPHSIDNSSGGQAWVTSDRWGPLHGALLLTSYGQSSLYLVMPETVSGRLQGATYCFPLKFQSGIMRARFNPKDGQLYVCGLKGWQTTGLRTGAFQRVRFTGKTTYLPREIHNFRNGIRLSFTGPLDPKTATDVESWGISQWNYRWTSAYGSHEWSVMKPDREGHDTVDIKSVHLSEDHKSAFLEIPRIEPVMTMQIQYNVLAEDGTPMQQEVYNTIHELAPPASLPARPEQ